MRIFLTSTNPMIWLTNCGRIQDNLSNLLSCDPRSEILRLPERIKTLFIDSQTSICRCQLYNIIKLPELIFFNKSFKIKL